MRLTRDLIVLYLPDGSWSNVKKDKKFKIGSRIIEILGSFGVRYGTRVLSGLSPLGQRAPKKIGKIEYPPKRYPIELSRQLTTDFH